MTGKQLTPASLRRTTEAFSKQQCRTFTSSSRRKAQQDFGQMRSQINKRMGGQKSLQAQMARMKRSDLPSDLGLLAAPNTMLKPQAKDLPALFSDQWKKRISIEYKALAQPFWDYVTFIYMTKWLAKKDPITKKRPRNPFLSTERYFVARELHKELYNAVAAGDREAIEKIACTGLQRQLQIRLDHRKALSLPPETWNIKYRGYTGRSPRTPWVLQALMPPSLKSTRILSDKSMALPIGRDGTIRQVFVQIDSTQTLDKNDGNGAKEAKMREIVVIQKMIIDGEEDDWKIWGTVGPQTMEQINDMLKQQSSRPNLLSKVKENFQGTLSKAGGGTSPM